MDSFTAALSRLDPASRALLDLSLRRGMKPEEISDLLGTEPESVVVAREGALEQLAGELGMADVSELDEVRTRLAELPAEAWTGQAAPARPKLAVVRDEKRQARAEEAPPPERKSRLPWLLALLAIAAVVLVIVLASSGGSDGKKAASAPSPSKPAASKPPPKPKPASQPRPAGPHVALARLSAAGGAHGTATLTQGGKRLRLAITGLPDPHADAYQVWLYNSVVDAVSVTKASGTKLSLDLKLPRHASHYKYVDVSLEPPDGNPNHSGESVLRVPLAKLEAR